MPRIQTLRAHTAIGRSLATLVIAGALAACGGATPSASAGAAGSGAGASAATATAATAASVAPGSTAGTAARGADGAVKACALLSSEALEAAVGTHVIEAVPYGDPECRWRVEPLPAFPGAADTWLDVQFFANDLPMQAVESAPDTKGVVAVDGLGDRAFRTNAFHHLWVKHGSDVFVVRSRLRALGDDSEASRFAGEALEVLLARAVLAQL